MEKNLITKSIEIAGLSGLARALGVTYQAVRKWEARGRLPRTEWTGETNYAALIESVTNGRVRKADLLLPPSDAGQAGDESLSVTPSSHDIESEAQ